MSDTKTIADAIAESLPSAVDNETAFRIAIVRARQKGSPEGFVVGDPVVVDGIPEQLKIKEINGDEAVVWIYGDESSARIIAYDELIDMGIMVNEMFIALTEVQFGDRQTRH